MTEQEFLTLLDRFKEGMLTTEERHALSQAVTTGAFDKLLEENILEELLRHPGDTTGGKTVEAQQLLQHFRNMEAPPLKKVSHRRQIMKAAAVVISLICIGGALLYRQPRKKEVVHHAPATPGSNKAVLTLANGEQVVLDDKGTIQLPQQGAATALATQGQLVYSQGQHADNMPEQYNTLHTPNGGQYKLALQDGTQVWLNAGSSITFPPTFRGAERRITLEGEAYFEVAKDAAHPFVIHTGAMDVKVLGTRFNIMSYPDEPVTTATLVDGAIVVSSKTGKYQLQPGQQAIQQQQGDIRVQPADTEEITAWVKGLFIFNKTDMQAALRQLSRWYNVDVAYEGNPEGKKLTGEIYRNYQLSQALKILNGAGLKCRLEGRKLTVML
ncbi:MAG TPA: FecR domain-containing protein [Chitinophaga sp.]|uniref:FecR family protein n=1 Tax=Chitinophaga sp. TaxID=1869181 RepID=UPI002C927327|nr:FecR domain-containing protein [Chitinophaga sp.]HVI48542.1 FecR domain-containing protein [Chitinophaga sp.]